MTVNTEICQRLNHHCELVENETEHRMVHAVTRLVQAVADADAISTSPTSILGDGQRLIAALGAEGLAVMPVQVSPAGVAELLPGSNKPASEAGS